MLDWKQCEEVERKPGVMNNAWVFKGTRVPVEVLFENLQGGAKIDEILAWFPTVKVNQVQSVLSFAQKSLVEA